jgi:tetratricopeptide (TPR) repeat protein
VEAFGSGVAVAPDEVVTNKHVIDAGFTVRVRQGEKVWTSTVTHIDAEHDRATLKVEALQAAAVKVRPSSDLQVGDRVYAIGAPQGLELSFSEGIISALRDYGEVRVIQTTAAISPGSSGGGLFDTETKLVGITTFNLLEGQSLNFALPGAWVLGLDKHAVSARKETSDAPYEAFLWFQRGFEAVKRGQDQQARDAFEEAVRLQPDVAVGWYRLGVAYFNLGQDQQARDAYREAIRLKPDDAEAWYGLGLIYSIQGSRSKVMEVYQQLKILDPEKADKFFNEVVLP